MDNVFVWLFIIIAASAAAGGFQQRQKRKPLSKALAVVAVVALLGIAACVAMLRNR